MNQIGDEREVVKRKRESNMKKSYLLIPVFKVTDSDNDVLAHDSDCPFFNPLNDFLKKISH